MGAEYTAHIERVSCVNADEVQQKLLANLRGGDFISGQVSQLQFDRNQRFAGDFNIKRLGSRVAGKVRGSDGEYMRAGLLLGWRPDDFPRPGIDRGS